MNAFRAILRAEILFGAGFIVGGIYVAALMLMPQLARAAVGLLHG